MKKNPLMLYRYNDYADSGNGASIQLDTVVVASSTPCGYHYFDGGIDEEGNETVRWVSNNGRRRKYYDTKELAWGSYKARKAKQLAIVRNKLKRIELINQTIPRIEGPLKWRYYHIQGSVLDFCLD